MRLTATLTVCCLLAPAALVRAETKEEQVAHYLTELKSKDAPTRKKAAEEIGKIGQIKASTAKPALQPLLGLLKDKDADVRAATATALSQIDEPKEVVPALAKILKDEKNAKVKTAIASGLGLMGEASKEALPELRAVAEQAKKDDDKRLARAVGDAMKQITGKNKKP